MLVAFSPVLSGQQPASDSSKPGPPDKCHTVAIIGAVRTPGRFELHRNLTLKELIACAGGLVQRAGRAVQIVHMGAAKGCPNATDPNSEWAPPGILEIFTSADVLRGEEKSNPFVHAGDIVVVLELDPVYIISGVLSPQAIFLKETLTLTQAIAIAGGVTHDSKTEKIRIFRRTLGSSARTDITVNLKAIRKRRAEDPVLQPFDIVEVPVKHERHGIPLGPVDPAFSLPLLPIC